MLITLLDLAMIGMLSACAGAPPREKLGMQIAAAADVNPDMQGRPSPIILHIMELNSTEQFNRLDYMGLTQPSGAGLGAELLGKNQLVLQPGEAKSQPMELNPMTTAIGLVAGYRDIDNAAWRTSISVVQRHQIAYEATAPTDRSGPLYARCSRTPAVDLQQPVHKCHALSLPNQCQRKP